MRVHASDDTATLLTLNAVRSWEYPGTQGTGCNTIVPEDTTNFLLFLKQLRAHPVGRRLLITAATSVFPWRGADEEPLTDVSEFAKVFDWIAIMNYDLWGSWSEAVGPNAPLVFEREYN